MKTYTQTWFAVLLLGMLTLQATAQSEAEWSQYKTAHGIDSTINYNDWVNSQQNTIGNQGNPNAYITPSHNYGGTLEGQLVNGVINIIATPFSLLGKLGDKGSNPGINTEAYDAAHDAAVRAEENSGRLAEAEADVRSMLQMIPGKYGYLELGGILIKEGRYDEAEQAFQQSRNAGLSKKEWSEWLVYLYLCKGHDLDQRGNNVDAELAFRKAIEDNPKSSLGWNDLAIALSKQGKLEEAKSDELKAIELDSNNEDYRNTLTTIAYAASANNVKQIVQDYAQTVSAASTVSGLNLDSFSQQPQKQQQTPDTADKKLFTTKQAMEDALTAKAHGEVGIGALAGNLPDITFSREILNEAVTAAKTETDQKFAQLLVNDRHFDTVVIPGDSGTQAQTLQVPDALKKDPRFKKLVIQGEALQHQDQDLGKQIQAITADPAYKQDPTKLVKVDQLQAAQNGIQGMEGYINKVTKDVVAGTVNTGSLDFSDAPPPKRGLDNTFVPSPTQ